jgi:hypothetical protein
VCRGSAAKSCEANDMPAVVVLCSCVDTCYMRVVLCSCVDTCYMREVLCSCVDTCYMRAVMRVCSRCWGSR